MKNLDDYKTNSSTLSAAPSLSNSKISLGTSSQCSQKSTSSSKKSHLVVPTERSLTRDEIIAAYLEKAKFYTSLCLGTTAILSAFAFLFAVPFVIDPAISAITADFDPEPVTCTVSDHTYSEGIKNCTWSSCREGCTTAQTKCHQLLVNYSKIPYKDWLKAPVDIELMDWDVSDTKFLINTEGCGYPPSVNCSIFAKEFGYENARIKTFPCYYSRAFNQIVVARYSWDDNLKHLILSIIIPNVLFAVSIGVLSYWYCPCCDKACHKNPRVYAEFPTAKENDEEEADDEY